MTAPDLREQLADKLDLLKRQWDWVDRNEDTATEEQIDACITTLHEYESLQHQWNEVMACLSPSEAKPPAPSKQLTLIG